MVTMERNEHDFIKSVARDLVQNSRIGHVTQVYTHTVDDDNSNFEVDVAFPGNPEDKGHRAIPVINQHSNSIAVPKVGDKVVVEYIHGDKKNAIVRGNVSTNKDRPPKGESGMWRQRIESATSPSGDGDLYLSAHTRYDENPASNDYRDLTPEQAFVRIAKKADAMDEPSDEPPMLLEVFDDPLNDESRITIEGNAVDGDSSKSMNATFDFKEGTVLIEASNSTGDFGLKLDVNNGTFTIIDQNGYGIESDGSGNFTWHYESIDYSQGTTTNL